MATNTMGGARPRNADDAYLTPQALADAIGTKLRERIGDVDLVVEPSAGQGAFVRSARSTWGERPPILAVEPNADENTILAAGATLHWRRRWEDGWTGYQLPALVLIVGNPPFNLAESHVRIALERLGHPTAPMPQPRWLAFLLRASFEESKTRREFWRDNPARFTDTIVPRPSFTRGGTDGAFYKLFTWQVGYRGATETGILDWRPEPVVLTADERAEKKRLATAQRAKRVRKALALATPKQLRDELARRSA